MSMKAGATGMLHHLAGQWAARIGRGLAMIVEAILMLVENLLGASVGVKPRSPGAARGTVALDGKKIAASHHKRDPWLDLVAAAQSQDPRDESDRRGAAPGSASPSIVQLSAG